MDATEQVNLQNFTPTSKQKQKGMAKILSPESVKEISNSQKPGDFGHSHVFPSVESASMIF